MILKDVSLIKGLKYIENFLNKTEKDKLLTVINSHPWCHRLRRSQQYYGIKYFQTKLVDHILQPSQSHDHYPLEQLRFLVDKAVREHNLFSPEDPPNQILVNQYLKHDKLGLHVQDTSSFGDIICGISLGSTDYLRLMNVDDKSQQYKIELKDCSCYILRDQARLKWRHGIGRVLNNVQYKTHDFKRISITLRHVIESRRKVENPLSSIN